MLLSASSPRPGQQFVHGVGDLLAMRGQGPDARAQFIELRHVVYSVRTCLAARRAHHPTARETPFEPMAAA